MNAYGKRIFYGLIAANLATWVAFAVLLTGCAGAIPVVAGASATAAVVVTAEMQKGTP